MKAHHWFVAVSAIVFLAVVLLVRNNQDIKAEPVGVAPTVPGIAAPTESAKAPDTEFTLKTITDRGKLAFQGVGGQIDGSVNPDLHVKQGAIVKITLLNADGMPHNVFFPDIEAQSGYVAKIGEQTELVFEVGMVQPGSYFYYCEVPGHRQAGQEGKLIVAGR